MVGKQRGLRVIVFIVWLIGGLFSPLCALANEHGLRSESLVIGVISTNPKKAFKRTQPLADYLAAQLQHHNIKQGQVVIAKDVAQMARWIKSGQVDLVSETAHAAHQLMQDAEAELLARQWKSGVAEYASVFFSRTNNGVDSLDDLVGKTIVFEDRGSTSAFLIPAAVLLEQGYPLYELSSPREQPPAGKIGYFFSDEFSKSGGESNMMSWVHRNIVAAAAFSNLDWEKEIPEAIRSELHIIHTSRFVPRALMLASPALPSHLKQSITEILLNAHQNEQGRQALNAYKNTKKFDAITPEIRQSLQWSSQQHTSVGEYFIHLR